MSYFDSVAKQKYFSLILYGHKPICVPHCMYFLYVLCRLSRPYCNVTLDNIQDLNFSLGCKYKFDHWSKNFPQLLSFIGKQNLDTILLLIKSKIKNVTNKYCAPRSIFILNFFFKSIQLRNDPVDRFLHNF